MGGALEFDGVDDYTEIPNSPSLNPKTITILAWVYLTDYPPTYGSVVVGKVSTSNVGGYTAGVSDTGRVSWWIYDAGSWHGGWDFGQVLSKNEWYHLAFVYDGSEMKDYVNGSLDNTLSYSGAIDSITVPVHLAHHLFSDTYLPAIIDEVRIYDRVLSEAEVSLLYEISKCTEEWNL